MYLYKQRTVKDLIGGHWITRSRLESVFRLQRRFYR